MNTVQRIGMAGLAALLLAVLTLAGKPAGAQDNPPAIQPWMQMTFIDVDPSMVEEFLSVQRDVTARLRGGGRGGRGGGAAGGGGRGGGGGGRGGDGDAPAGPAGYRIVSRSDVFGDNYRFVVLTPAANLASLDARNNDPELAALNSRAMRYVTGQHSIAIRTLPDVSNPLPERQAPAMIMVNVVKVVFGREQQYLNLMKSDFLPHFDKANYNHQTGSVAFGGDGGFIHMYYIPNLAKLDEGSPIVRSLGVEAAQAVTAKFSGIVSSNEQWVVRVIPDLSFGPWSGQAARPQ